MAKHNTVMSTRENDVQRKLNGEELWNVDHFKYMRSSSDKTKDSTIDMDIRVQAEWSG